MPMRSEKSSSFFAVIWTLYAAELYVWMTKFFYQNPQSHFCCFSYLLILATICKKGKHILQDQINEHSFFINSSCLKYNNLTRQATCVSKSQGLTLPIWLGDVFVVFLGKRIPGKNYWTDIYQAFGSHQSLSKLQVSSFWLSSQEWCLTRSIKDFKSCLQSCYLPLFNYR